MTEIVFSFDTEDFTSNEAATAILDEAGLLRDEGVRGCFCVTGLLANQLAAWRRDDVVVALKHHEVDVHSFGHTMHPTIDEYTDVADYDAAYAELHRQESRGVELVKSVFGRDRVYAQVPPGNEASYVAMYAYADMGIPIFAGTCCDTPDGRGAYYCNIYHVAYTESLEGSLMAGRADEAIPAFVERMAKKRRAVVYTHPNIAYFRVFWDVLNYSNGNIRKFGDWIRGRRRDPAETRNFFDNIRKFIRALKADGRFRFTTYSEIAAGLGGERKILRSDIPALRGHFSRGLAPVGDGRSFSVADVFLACRDFLAGAEEHVCGKVYGFLEKPFAAEGAVTVSAADMAASARKMDATRFLPPEITVGGRKIGPADWLRAALDILSGQAAATVRPGPAMPSLDAVPGIRDCALKGTWLHSGNFEDRYLSDRLRLQAWTLRF